MDQQAVASGNRSGLSRRDLIKRGAVVGGIAWTAPMILESVAGAQTSQCSPCECTINYSAKWNTSAANVCAVTAGAPNDCGKDGIDPPCGNVSGGASSYTCVTAGTFGTLLERVACSSTSITWRLKCNGHFYGGIVKGGNDPCVQVLGDECTRQITLPLPSNLSHFTLYFCCC